MKLTAMQQFKVPEVATDAAMAYMGLQLDQQHATDSFHHSGAPDPVIGSLMTGVHGVGTLVGLIGAEGWREQGDNDTARLALAQGVWEGVKTAGFALQIGGMGVAGAALVGCGTLGDACSGWATDFVTSWQNGRDAKKNRGPQGCNGPED
ncbi:MAG: hypothetical protein ACYCW6_24950 [Candidatus Xenobia bacterium]